MDKGKRNLKSHSSQLEKWIEDILSKYAYECTHGEGKELRTRWADLYSFLEKIVKGGFK